MELRDSVTDVAAKAMSVGHKAILRVTGGRVLGTAYGMQVVELHTTGRKSGARRSTMLTAPIYEDARAVLIASKGGDDRHPDWYRNLVANPDVELTTDGVTRPMRARTASPDEKAALWPRIIEVYKGYDGYQQRTDRDIPVIICEPRDS
ncbi:MAG TPA: nitroreductase family deazaflavin-dependent oxidoreductase [Acidimicrobiales bacterium]|jgi:deazaflavin-dependent oxidoreductase (nitroreductase family)